MDINTKLLKKNAYRITKKRGKTAIRIRVPGGHIEAKHFEVLQRVAETYGDGNIHITIRQGFEIHNIDIDKIPEVNKMIQSVIDGLEINQISPNTGYSAAGTRNVSACIGANVCPFANYNTTDFAKKIEKEIFP
jgi:anaerobic sulfite reductase subunit C